MSYPVLNELLDQYGVDYEIIKSGPYKDSGSSFRSPNRSDSLYFQNVVDNMYQQFIYVLKYERGMSDNNIKRVGNGKVFTGLQAKEVNLIDVLGTLEDSINLLLKMTGNSNKVPKIIDSYEDDYSFFDSIFSKANKIIPFNKMLLYPLPEFKLYYQGY